MTVPAPTAQELAEVERANSSGKQPVVFVHGLWLLDTSWDRWAEFFEAAGYAAVTPGWPDDPATVEEARANPDVFANKGIGDVAAYQQAIVEKLDRKPAIIGHSFGAGCRPRPSRSTRRPRAGCCRCRPARSRRLRRS